MSRPQVDVHIQMDHAGSPLQSMVAALLKPLLTSCDVYIHTSVRQQPLLGVNTPPETETTDDQR